MLISKTFCCFLLQVQISLLFTFRSLIHLAQVFCMCRYRSPMSFLVQSDLFQFSAEWLCPGCLKPNPFCFMACMEKQFVLTARRNYWRRLRLVMVDKRWLWLRRPGTLAEFCLAAPEAEATSLSAALLPIPSTCVRECLMQNMNLRNGAVYIW